MNTLVNRYQDKYKYLKIYFFIISILLFIINSKDKKIKDLSFMDCLLFLSNIVIGYLIYNEYLNKDNTTIILNDLKNYQRSIDSRLETINSKNTQLSKSILPKRIFLGIALLLFTSSIGTIAYKNKDSLKLKSNGIWTKVFTIVTGNSQDKTPQSDTSESLLEEMVSKNIQSGFSTVKDNPVSSFFGTTTLVSLFALKKAKVETASAKEAANAEVAKVNAEISKLKNAKVIPQMIRNNKFKLFSGLALTFLSRDLYHATENDYKKINLDKTYSYGLIESLYSEYEKPRKTTETNSLGIKMVKEIEGTSFKDMVGKYLKTPISDIIKNSGSSNPNSWYYDGDLAIIDPNGKAAVKKTQANETQANETQSTKSNQTSYLFTNKKEGGKLSVKKIKSKNDATNKSQKNNSKNKVLTQNVVDYNLFSKVISGIINIISKIPILGDYIKSSLKLAIRIIEKNPKQSINVYFCFLTRILPYLFFMSISYFFIDFKKKTLKSIL